MEDVITILKTLYESLWISLVLALLFSISNLYVKGVQLEQPGWKNLIWMVKEQFRLPQFRHSFYLFFYTAMLLYKTLLGRKVLEHPLQAVLGGWRMINYYGHFDIQVVGNAVIFVPFVILLFWTYREKIINGTTVWSYLMPALKITLLFSLSIEVLQAVLHLGTLQISDFFYNVIGGVIGGLIYWCGYRIKHRKKAKKVSDL